MAQKRPFQFAGFPRIVCDLCNQQVANTTVEYLSGTDMYRFVVTCHGQLDKCELPGDALRNGWIIDEGHAFRKKDTEVEVVEAELVQTEPTDEQLALEFSQAITGLRDTLVANHKRLTGPKTVDPDLNDPLLTLNEALEEYDPSKVTWNDMCTAVPVPSAGKFDVEVSEWATLVKEAI